MRSPDPAGSGTSEATATPKQTLRNAKILITGGTGSFGNRVAHFLTDHNPAEIRIFSRDEKKQWEMHLRYPDFSYIIGDVRDAQRLSDAMRDVDYVFHAAALKQVPSCEFYPFEAVKTNVIGSHNVCAAARDAGVKTVVALSTDKAVKPVNAMGMTKAIMEKIVCSQNIVSGDTIFCCVRYGNVMGSRGSVIPLFRQQITADSPITLTVPHMTRFLMTLDESVDLVMHAMLQARGGEVFIKKAPACTVRDLAEAMRLKYSPRGAQHPIETVGIRTGEKIHEVLVNEYEMQRAKEEVSYFTIAPEWRNSGTNSSKPPGVEYTSENTTRLSDPAAIADLLDAAERSHQASMHLL
jgi:FlaA1/EpsC-like NDP-sugar epimerase